MSGPDPRAARTTAFFEQCKNHMLTSMGPMVDEADRQGLPPSERAVALMMCGAYFAAMVAIGMGVDRADLEQCFEQEVDLQFDRLRRNGLPRRSVS